MTEVDVTVVIGQHGDALVKRVQDIVEGWTAAGILRPFVWWSGVHDAEHFVRWSGPDAAEQPLLTALGERPYRLIRLLTLIVVPGDSAEPARDVRDVATRVEAIVKRRRAVRQGVSLVNLVVPATGVTNLPGRLLDSAWDVNLVATDEDRATAEHSSLEVRAPDRLAAHAAIELATVAGLWSGMVAGAFDGDREGSGGQEATVRVIRSFARTVRSHGLVDQVANLVLDSHENQGWVAQAVGARLAKDPEHVVERAAADYFERAGGQLLCRTPPPVVSPPPVVEVSPWQAFRMMWDFMADRARQLPREWVDRGAIGARSAVEQFTQDATFGDDSTVVVRMGARTVTAHIGAPVPLTSGVVDLARALREKVAAQSPPATPPQAWRELRGLAFGLADAGPLPTGCTEPAGVRTGWWFRWTGSRRTRTVRTLTHTHRMTTVGRSAPSTQRAQLGWPRRSAPRNRRRAPSATGSRTGSMFDGRRCCGGLGSGWSTMPPRRKADSSTRCARSLPASLLSKSHRGRRPDFDGTGC